MECRLADPLTPGTGQREAPDPSTTSAQDTLTPTWAGGPVDVGPIPAGAFLEFRTIDADLMFDAEGHVAAEAYRCSGQLWGLAVRVA